MVLLMLLKLANVITLGLHVFENLFNYSYYFISNQFYLYLSAKSWIFTAKSAFTYVRLVIINITTHYTV